MRAGPAAGSGRGAEPSCDRVEREALERVREDERLRRAARRTAGSESSTQEKRVSGGAQRQAPKEVPSACPLEMGEETGAD